MHVAAGCLTRGLVNVVKHPLSPDGNSRSCRWVSACKERQYFAAVDRYDHNSVPQNMPRRSFDLRVVATRADITDVAYMILARLIWEVCCIGSEFHTSYVAVF
jgi:hypothetical protein